MPYSDNRLRPAVLKYLQSMEFVPRTVLDVGCGAGANYEFYYPWWPASEWTALDAWPPYMHQFSIYHRYKEVIINDVRNNVDFDYDLVIFGDILEHLPKEEAWEVLDKALSEAEVVLVALPIIHYPQGALEGNPYEEHVSEWTWSDFSHHPDLLAAYKNEVTGSFILQGH